MQFSKKHDNMLIFSLFFCPQQYQLIWEGVIYKEEGTEHLLILIWFSQFFFKNIIYLFTIFIINYYDGNHFLTTHLD